MTGPKSNDRIGRYISLQLLGTLFVMLWAAIGTAVADTRSDAVWQEFRNRYPLHLQVVGVSDASASGERVLVISEPPPLLPKASYAAALRVVFGPALKSAGLQRQQLGDDGWCEDVVATLAYPNTSEGTATLAEDLTRLAQRLFGTAYKFAPLRLSEGRQPSAAGQTQWRAIGPLSHEAPPDLRVSAAEQEAWLLAPGRTVQALDAGTDHAVIDLLRDGRPNVYLSHERGLVMLLVPQDETLNVYRGLIRKFALDTDAIVGAMTAGARRLLIIGRERDTSIIAVPPLRVETILALAATREAQLGQSYERRAPFAGKLESGKEEGWDWAPIYLSEDLQ